jgi:mannose-6-phosphate isomerase-like protein (cupin superfamily)
MFRRKKLVIAASFGAVVAAGATAVASTRMPELLGTTVIRWSDARSIPRDGGEMRMFFQAPTSTLLHIGLRAMTLPPGGSPHPTRPHSRGMETVLIVKEGTLEVQIDQDRQQLEEGSAVFLQPNQWHSLRNPGNEPVTFYELDWVPPGMAGEALMDDRGRPAGGFIPPRPGGGGGGGGARPGGGGE